MCPPGQVLRELCGNASPSLAVWRWTQTPEQPTSAKLRMACTSVWLCLPLCSAVSRAQLLGKESQCPLRG